MRAACAMGAFLWTFAAAGDPRVAEFADDRVVNDAGCRKDADGYCTSKRVTVTLDADYDSKAVLLNMALGDVVTIAIRPPLKIRTCEERVSDTETKRTTYCGVANGNKALLRVEVEERLIKVTPQIPAGLELQEDETATDAVWYEHANLQIVTATGQQVTFDVQVRPPEQAVKQVIIRSPELQAAERELDALCAERNKEAEGDLRKAWSDLQATAQRLAAENMTYAVLAEPRCRSHHWTAMRDLLWVRVYSLCRIDTRIYVSAKIENRSDETPFEIDKLVLFADGAKADDSPLGAKSAAMAFKQLAQGPKGRVAKRLEVTDVELHYGESVHAGIGIDAPRKVPRHLALEVHELGGGQRVVRVGGIGF